MTQDAEWTYIETLPAPPGLCVRDYGIEDDTHEPAVGITVWKQAETGAIHYEVATIGPAQDPDQSMQVPHAIGTGDCPMQMLAHVQVQS